MSIEKAKQLAQDETTPPEILAELAKHDDKLTRQYVAGNPNTPVETLLRVCFEFPNEVTSNPIIPLLLLEDYKILTCKMRWNFNDIKRLTDIEIKRLNWKKGQGQVYLISKYGKRSRLHMTDIELLDFLQYLQSLP